MEKKNQNIIDNYSDLNEIINLKHYNNILVVCSKTLVNSFITKYLKQYNSNITFFTEFTPNPKYEEVVKGIELFKKNNCDLIISIGGGSAIDVSKCIKGFSTMDNKVNYLEQSIIENNIELVAVPTTAGTGSESTCFAVIYFNGKKYSVDSECILPDYVILEPKFLETLPLYQKKSTILDALCQGIESYWSVNSTDESREYSKKTIKLILENYKQYILENKDVYNNILKAANYSGKAINISKTTSAHAMSYKITSLYGISHGHAVALCLPYIWEYMINNLDKCIDKRGKEYLSKVFDELNNMFNSNNSIDTINMFKNLLISFNLDVPIIENNQQLELLSKSVNTERLKNNPVEMDYEIIKTLYKKILK